MANKLTYYLDCIDKDFELMHCHIESILGDLSDKNRVLLTEFQAKVVELKQDFDEVSREIRENTS